MHLVGNCPDAMVDPEWSVSPFETARTQELAQVLCVGHDFHTQDSAVRYCYPTDPVPA
jgi:hypothetical protein